tara:strand:+ start:264 stop:596 length:333 start_codon:yes stop_codon:yes gene_type:complete
MSDSGSILQQFNINELAGATGLILGALGGILAIIFKSRCYCRLNLCYLCFCERKPPPDPIEPNSSDEENIVPKKEPVKEPEKKIDRNSKEREPEPEPEPEYDPKAEVISP